MYDSRDRSDCPFTSIVVPMTSLAQEPFRLNKPISAVIAGRDDSYTATFFDANVSAGGDTQQEAFDNLKELLVMSFKSLEDDHPDTLGPAMKRQKAVLEEFIRRT